MKKIFFNNPSLQINSSTINNLKKFSSNGPITKKCINWLKKNLKCKFINQEIRKRENNRIYKEIF